MGSPQLFELSDFHSKTEALMGGAGMDGSPAFGGRHMEQIWWKFRLKRSAPFRTHLVYRKDPALDPRVGSSWSCCSMPVEWTSRAEP